MPLDKFILPDLNTDMILNSADAVVEALGGTGAVAASLGVGSTAVSNWRAKGTIPAEYFLALVKALDRLDLQADPAVFSMKFTNEASP